MEELKKSHQEQMAALEKDVSNRLAAQKEAFQAEKESEKSKSEDSLAKVTLAHEVELVKLSEELKEKFAADNADLTKVGPHKNNIYIFSLLKFAS